MQGLEIIKDGVICRIGNGQNVDICKDPWLSRGMTWRPMTPRGRNLMQKVEELIDSVIEDWLTGMSNFCPNPSGRRM